MPRSCSCSIQSMVASPLTAVGRSPSTTRRPGTTGVTKLGVQGAGSERKEYRCRRHPPRRPHGTSQSTLCGGRKTGASGLAKARRPWINHACRETPCELFCGTAVDVNLYLQGSMFLTCLSGKLHVLRPFSVVNEKSTAESPHAVTPRAWPSESHGE